MQRFDLIQPQTSLHAAFRKEQGSSCVDGQSTISVACSLESALSRTLLALFIACSSVLLAACSSPVALRTEAHGSSSAASSGVPAGARGTTTTTRSLAQLKQAAQSVRALANEYAPELATASELDPATLAALTANSKSTALVVKAMEEIVAKAHVTPTVAIARLVALGRVPPNVISYLDRWGPIVARAVKDGQLPGAQSSGTGSPVP